MPPAPNLPPAAPEPAQGPSDRWRGARAQYTKYAKSGGTNSGALLSALAGYIGRSLGGAGAAARRMSSSQAAARELGGVVGDFATRGVEPTLQGLGLGDLVGRPLAEVLLTVLERVCPRHGVAHPDPDSVEQAKVFDPTHEGEHGLHACCGCCTP